MPIFRARGWHLVGIVLARAFSDSGHVIGLGGETSPVLWCDVATVAGAQVQPAGGVGVVRRWRTMHWFHLFAYTKVSYAPLKRLGGRVQGEVTTSCNLPKGGCRVASLAMQ
jgi:hypothetical protein